MKVNKQIFVVTLFISISMLFLVGCTSTSKVENSFEAYKKAWESQDFGKMYDMLASQSKNKISKDEFIERYTKIYPYIGIENLKVSTVDSNIKKDKEFNIKVSMDTIGGKIESSEAKLMIKEEGNEYKVLWNESLILPQLKEGDKVGYETDGYKGKRGSIYDRNNNLLAGEGVLRPIQINMNLFNDGSEVEKIEKIASILDISKGFVEKKIASNTNPNHAIHIVELLETDTEKINSLIEIKGVQIPKATQNSRVYYGGEALGSLVGYIDNITKEQLEKNKDKGYTGSSKIGVGGIEEVYEEKLRAIDGGKIYIKRANGKDELIAEKKAKDGQDIKLSIDLDLQQKIYEEMQREKGASVALDPKSGEVLAMVSSPSFDSNTYTTYLTKTEKQRWEESGNAHKERRFKNAYSPGSTMKLVTAVGGLESGKINPEEPINIEGKVWEEYKVTRVNDKANNVNLKDATKYSDNIYFAKVGIDIGGKNYVDIAKKFGIGEDLKFEYPIAKSKISNSGNLNDKALLADTAYGQGEVLTTPLHVAMMYSSLGNNGNIMYPKLDITNNTEPKEYKKAIENNILPLIKDCFESVVNDSDGTGNKSKVEGINIAGKTGTAEIKSSKDDNMGTENGWFVAVDTTNSKIAISMIIEDVKNRGGSDLVTPKVGNVLRYYLNK